MRLLDCLNVGRERVTVAHENLDYDEPYQIREHQYEGFQCWYSLHIQKRFSRFTWWIGQIVWSNKKHRLLAYMKKRQILRKTNGMNQ